MIFKKLTLLTLAAACLAQPVQAMHGDWPDKQEVLKKAYGISKEIIQKHPGKAAIALWVTALLLPKRSPKALSQVLTMLGYGLLVYEYPKTTVTVTGLLIAAAADILLMARNIQKEKNLILKNNTQKKDLDDSSDDDTITEKTDKTLEDNLKSNDSESKNEDIKAIKKVWSSCLSDDPENIDAMIDAINKIFVTCIENKTIRQTLNYNNAELYTWSKNLVETQKIVGSRQQSADALHKLIYNTYMLHKHLNNNNKKNQ